MGYLISEILNLLHLRGPETIYTDSDQKSINGDLFFPFIAKKYRNQSPVILQSGVSKLKLNWNFENFDTNFVLGKNQTKWR